MCQGPPVQGSGENSQSKCDISWGAMDENELAQKKRFLQRIQFYLSCFELLALTSVFYGDG